MNILILLLIFIILFSTLGICAKAKSKFGYKTILKIYVSIMCIMLLFMYILGASKLPSSIVIATSLFSYILTTLIEDVYFWKPGDDDHFGGQGKKFKDFFSYNEYIDDEKHIENINHDNVPYKYI